MSFVTFVGCEWCCLVSHFFLWVFESVYFFVRCVFLGFFCCFEVLFWFVLGVLLCLFVCLVHLRLLFYFSVFLCFCTLYFLKALLNR